MWRNNSDLAYLGVALILQQEVGEKNKSVSPCVSKNRKKDWKGKKEMNKMNKPVDSEDESVFTVNTLFHHPIMYFSIRKALQTHTFVYS